MLGAVVAWAVSAQVSASPALGFAAAMVVAPLAAGAVALAADRLVLRRLHYEPEATIIATIGLLYVIQQTVLMTFGADARAVEAPVSFRIRFPWFGYAGYKLVVVGVALLLLAAAGSSSPARAGAS